MQYVRLIALSLLCLWLGACSTLDANDCREGDWEQIGEDDADNGRSPDIFARHLEACAPHGITPDRDSWQSGYSAGLEDYCTARGGITAGRDGRSYQHICDAAGEEDFLKGYRAGRDIYRATAEVQEIESLQRQYQYELQFNRSLSTELRRRYIAEVIRLEQRLSRATDDISRFERAAEALLRTTTAPPRQDN